MNPIVFNVGASLEVGLPVLPPRLSRVQRLEELIPKISPGVSRGDYPRSLP
jgi:hypothetical protein